MILKIDKKYNVFRRTLYVYVMSKSFPTGKLKWLHPAKSNLDKYDDDGFRGCVSEVDLGYPKEPNKLHKDYPLATDKLEIKREMLSEFQ